VDAPVVALTHVRLIDGTGGAPQDDQTIVLRAGLIEAVGPTASTPVPPEAALLSLAGHTVIPGLVGLHEHTYFGGVRRMTQMAASGAPLYLAFGVTTAMTAGSQFPYHELSLKRAVDAGELPGPRFLITGPYLAGSTPRASPSRRLASPEEARRVIAYWAEEGATWFKVQGEPTRAMLAAIIEAAHARGLKVTGHLCSVTFTEAAGLGIDALQHGFITNSDYVPGKQPDICPPENMRIQADVDVASAPVQASIRDIVKAGAAVVSTLAVYETFVPERARLNPAAMEMLEAETRREVEANHAALAQGGLIVPTRLLASMMRWEHDFVAAGGLLGAGSDPWGSGLLPGFGNLRNYELLLEAGFTPAGAVRIMTLNGAKILGEDARIGSIASGKAADLVVIRGNPADAPTDIYRVVTVFKAGLGYDSARLRDAARGLIGLR
jgi:imidazolonepropionase-like amidohydrolase